MIHLITGGSGSGKSDYAENWLIHRTMISPGMEKPYLYIATMMPIGEETKKKIQRHHELRAGKGFTTIECYRALEHLEIPENAGILLECVTNLTANEYYRADGTMREMEDVLQSVIRGIRHLALETECLAIVTNEVHSDINGYPQQTESYRELLGRIHQQIGRIADQITEVVYGIPVPLKV